ncbi:MAG: putative HTH transcriptional regulator [Arenicella sp.]|jgi:predicted HTH transcriptional regulator
MLLRDLEKLVQRGEGERLEFKHKAADPQKIMKEVVAFANHKGGTLILGVDDNLKINGVKYVEEEEYAMTEAIETYCNPVPEYTIEKILITQKRTILIYRISQSEKKPVFLLYNLKKKVGKAYFRVADKSVQASRELRQILKWRSQSDRNSFFEYGELERKLMQLIEREGKTTIAQFAQEAEISSQKAASILVRLTTSNLLKIQPNDEEDFYLVKEV